MILRKSKATKQKQRPNIRNCAKASSPYYKVPEGEWSHFKMFIVKLNKTTTVRFSPYERDISKSICVLLLVPNWASDIEETWDAIRQTLWQWRPTNRRLCMCVWRGWGGVDDRNNVSCKFSKRVLNDLSHSRSNCRLASAITPTSLSSGACAHSRGLNTTM